MKKYKGIIIFILIAVAIFAVSSFLNDSNSVKEVPYSTVVNQVQEGKVESINIDNDKIYYKLIGTTNSNRTNEYDGYAVVPFSATINEFVAMATPLVDSVKFAPISSNSWLNTLLSIASLALPLIFIFILFKNLSGANNNAMNFGKTSAKVVQQSTVRFSDVAGADEEKEELKEIVEFLKSPKRFLQLGARIPKGVLLVGPPGTGKTLFAKAVAGEAGVPFFSISGSDFVEMFVGVGASRVRDIFDQAKKNMPCIIFIDEIDAVGRQRGTGLGGGHDEREQTLNQLLVQMDGFTKNDGIIVMAATNRADILDPALLRPGRFDRQIYVSYPDVKGREAILRVHARNKPLGDDINFKVLARMTSGFTGADIENLLNESAILAARAKRDHIIMTDILEGINKVIAGPRKTSRITTESDKRITAYHEAGHAILSKLLPYCDEVQEVTIIPRGMAAGYTLTRPITDDQHISKNKLIDQITMMLGGRAAEQIVIKDISTGASNDIERASDIARSMVTKWGMSDSIGNMALDSSREVFLGRDYQSQHNYSEELAAKIDTEVKSILDNCYANAIKLLSENRSILDNMVRVLFEKETIYTDEVSALMEGKSYEEVLSMDSNPKSMVNELVVSESDTATTVEKTGENTAE